MASRASPIIVGRDRDLARFDEAIEAASAGRPVLVTVRGEAGIGKSRLVREAIASARANGATILHGACLDLGGDGLPYLPIIEALRGLARETTPEAFEELLGAAGSDLAGLLPTLSAARSPGPAPAGSTRDPGSAPGFGARPDPSAADRARLFERFLDFLGRLGSAGVVLAVIEDVQWVDPATRDLLTFLVRNVTTEPIVAVLTCRTDDLAPGHPILAWLAELGRAPGAIRIDLQRLGRDDVKRQLDAIDGGPVTEDVLDSIWRRSEGHPLFAEELFEAVSDDDGARQPSLVDVLMGRVAGLGPETTVVVQTLAVAGRPIDERLISPVVDRSEREVGASLREATARGVLVALPDGRHAFRHELLREVVERDLSAGERRQVHERLASELEVHPELGDENPASAAGELARHWAAAEQPIKAYRSAIAAADAAERVNAFADAWRLLERAIGLEARLTPEGGPNGAERVAIRRRAAQVADLAGLFDRAAELVSEALALVDPDVDATLAGVLHARLGYLTWARGDAEAALAEHREAARLVPDDPPSTERAHVLGALGGALMGLGRWADSRPVCEAAIGQAVRAGAVREESRARNMLGSDLVALGEIERGLSELRESHRLAGTQPSELFVVTGYNLGLNLLAADRLDEALDVATTARAAARAGGLERRYGMDLAALAGDILMRIGRSEDADRVVGEGLRLDQGRRGTPYLATVAALLDARRGRPRDAAERLAAVDPTTLEPDMAAFVARARAESLLIEDRPADAAAAVEDGLANLAGIEATVWGAPLVALGLRAAAEQAEAGRAARRDAVVAEVVDRTAALRDRLGVIAEQARTPSTAAWVATGRAEAARVDGSADPDLWSAAIDAWDAIPEPAEAAYGRYRRAESRLRASGIKADVRGDLEAAWQTANRLGAEPLQAAIRTLAGRARVELGRPDSTTMPTPAAVSSEADARARPSTGGSPAPAYGLSAREVEVLRLVAAGRSNGQIADRLFITRKTAGVHVTHILDKLGVSNRVEAAMAAARLGLLDAAGEGDEDDDGSGQ